MESCDNIWNHHGKCIQISTNVPGIGSLICKIHVKIPEKWERKIDFRSVKPIPAFKVLTPIILCVGDLNLFLVYVWKLLYYQIIILHEFELLPATWVPCQNRYHFPTIFSSFFWWHKIYALNIAASQLLSKWSCHSEREKVRHYLPL